MLKRNIGPDLMIYLLSLVRQTTGAVPVAVAVVAQFSAHPASMSIRYGSSELRIGYWLAKIWAFEFMCHTERRHEAAICASAIVLMGARILMSRLTRVETLWSGLIVAEMSGVLWSAIRNRILLRTITESYLHIVHWMRPRAHQAIPT